MAGNCTGTTPRNPLRYPSCGIAPRLVLRVREAHQNRTVFGPMLQFSGLWRRTRHSTVIAAASVAALLLADCSSAPPRPPTAAAPSTPSAPALPVPARQSFDAWLTQI